MNNILKNIFTIAKEDKIEYDIEDMITKLLELYDFYQSYIWSKNDNNLKIKIISKKLDDGYKHEMMLTSNQTVLDAFELTFSRNEKALYEYISNYIMFKSLETVYMYNKDNVIYNNTHKPFLEVISEDNELLQEYLQIVKMVDDTNDKDRYDKVYNLLDNYYNKIPRENKNVDDDLMKTANNRLVLTKIMARNDFDV